MADSDKPLTTETESLVKIKLTGNNKYIHTVHTVSPSDIKYWKDGTYIGSLGRVANNSSTPHSYRIGGSLNNSTGRNWDGYFDELRLTCSSSASDARATGTGNITVPTEGLRLYTT